MTDQLRYFEDFVVGEVFRAGPYLLEEAEMLAFARQYDPQPIHIDPDRAAQSLHGGLIASGWQSCAIAMRLMVQSYLADTVSPGSPGVERIRWFQPVRAGDALSLTVTVRSARPSNSRPQLGIVENEAVLTNQHDQQVMAFHGVGLIERRPTIDI